MKYLVILFFLLLGHTVNANSQKTITLGVTKLTLESSNGQFIKKVLTEAFQNLHYKLNIHTYPALRLALVAKSGEIDGELVRMSTYNKNKPYLIKVKQPYFKFSIVLYGNDQKFRNYALNSFVGKTIGFRKGIKVVENELRKISNLKLEQFKNYHRPLSMLAMNRIDAFVGIEFFVDEYLNTRPKSFSQKIIKYKKLKNDSAHAFLGKKHAHLVTKLSRELLSMKKAGRFEAIRKSLKK
jgi:ABC-type amino acid transport substrate-binding protein